MQKIQDSIETENASDEEQAEYEKAVEFAMRSLHGGEVAKKTVARVLNAESVEKGVSEAVFVLLRRTEEEFTGLSDAVKFELAEDLVEELLEILVETDRLSESEITDELIGDVVQNLYMRYTEDAEQRGKLDKQSIANDVSEGSDKLGIEKPQGFAAMSNQERETRGLMNV